ncbi:MAG: potassium-transporting ATPase subunit KdpB [Leptospirales bacterium]|nr:potassium-transporting ATPase subunit KdpB [Leptospirales bacterium]
MQKTISLLDRSILTGALVGAFRKLSPVHMWRNPVMAIVAMGAGFCTLQLILDLFNSRFSKFDLQINVWLWFTVLFANFAEAIAEGRGKARADSLKKTRADTMANRVKNQNHLSFEVVSASRLAEGDLVVCSAGEVIPGDGEVVAGVASVDESAITGESAPVIRESGGDRSAVTGGTRVLSDRIVVRITAAQGNTFMDRMISLVEGARRQLTPNEIALSVLLISLSLVFILAVFTLPAAATFVAREGKTSIDLNAVVLVSLLVCLIPTTIAGLLSAVGISGMERLIKFNVIAMSGKAVESAGDIDVLLLDKTGTITLGNRAASSLITAPGVEAYELADAAQLASLSDETPEGRSIVVYCKEHFQLRARQLADLNGKFIQFSAATRMSGVDLISGGAVRIVRKGAAEAVRKHVQDLGGSFPQAIDLAVDTVARRGATPLVVCDGDRVLGVVELKDVVKGGIKERFERLRRMGIRTVMITGDNALTAAAIAAEAGVDDFVAQATPESKLIKLREEQRNGALVAMIGDGTNDAPALAQADVGVAMNSGTQVAREAGNMVDLDSNPTKLIEIVEIGKQLLMTRGALTTFSIANDVAKYFAILPAIFVTLFATDGMPGPLSVLNIMHLASPQSALLSAVIFNAIVIPFLIPLALKGVKYRPLGADLVLRNNLLLYGVGGLIVPFVGIKLIDLAIGLAGWV